MSWWNISKYKFVFHLFYDIWTHVRISRDDQPTTLITRLLSVNLIIRRNLISSNLPVFSWWFSELRHNSVYLHFKVLDNEFCDSEREVGSLPTIRDWNIDLRIVFSSCWFSNISIRLLYSRRNKERWIAIF